ncbi:sulfonate transport system substrate-binding protein [Pseudomonas sp. 2848]|uniref:aliphatic sulfonate ABC transporter substrate-binding protein n=1 Tax=Pseudomonas sp. 2848 TaxID=2183926 RepID=UPI000DACE7E1|nr:aliphatic sulfonate ABC transporter substrate-binding protein [Pseudomonas sp. 2848]PZW77447.1 sulfonate transport system substrate-binding protein [Pseudomonas sp. 2848]
MSHLFSGRHMLTGLLCLVLGGVHADETLRVSSQKNSLQVLLQAAGELDDVPYPLEFAAFGAAAPTAEALAAGAVDIGTLGTAPFVFATAAGAGLKTVGAVRLQVTPTAVAIVVPEASPLSDAASLVGRRITTTRGSIGHYLALAALRATGHSGRDATFVFLQPGESRSLLANGGADAWATWDPYTSMVQLEGGTRVLVSGEGLFAGNMLLVANPAAIRDKPAQLRDFLRRVGRAWDWANAHVEQFSAIQARQSGLPLEVHLRSNRFSQPRRVAVDDALVRDLADTARLYQDEGVITPGFVAKQQVDEQFNEAPEVQ